ncbi:MAG: M14 family metallopeptidase [Draconibacterium sp.]|nr:M14 family metallopeptidase [Draconibacterium sp.]
MIKKLYYFAVLGLLAFSVTRATAQSVPSFDKYHTNDEVQQIMKKLAGSSGTKLHTITTSPGDKPVTVLEIGANLKDVPAIFMGANFEGDNPLSTEGALYFAQMLLDSTNYTKNVKWFIMPQPNPDAAAGFFASVKYGATVNSYEINNDADNAVNEDGFDDLNGDGLITKMRVKDLQGTYILSEKDERILTRAKKDKRGIYKIYDEGLDNDGDGQYNEDGEGGINVGINFPHLFPKGKKEAGLFPGQAPEVYGIMRFIYDHPEIAMVYTLGNSGFCSVPPKGGRKGGANMESIKIPSRYAKRFGVDASKKYTMDEVIEMMKDIVPAGMEVTPSMVASFLSLGTVVNPLDADMKFYKSYSEDFKKYLEKKSFNTERLDPARAKDGSFELWAYYHLGVPSFSMNLFTVPKVKEEKKKDGDALSMDDVKKMSTEDFTALGESKIDTFLRANNAPEKMDAKRVLKMLDSGKFTPEKLVSMMKKMPKAEKEDELSEKDKALLAWSDKYWEGKGFVKWEKAEHPTLGAVEIGGFVPYLETTPKPELIDSLAKTQLPWLLQLSTKLPAISFNSEKFTELGDGVFKLEMYIENNGKLAYPIAMGQRNGQPAPIIIVLDGEMEFLQGKKRTSLGSLNGNQIKKLTWIIQAKKGQEISAKIESAVFTDVVKQIKIGG